jgi:dolichyl-phosphate-mannose--protein O-mannosyl transferase
MKAHWVTFACLLAAVACYVAYFSAGVIAFFILGVAWETAFWVRTLRRIHAARVIQTTVSRSA